MKTQTLFTLVAASMLIIPSASFAQGAILTQPSPDELPSAPLASKSPIDLTLPDHPIGGPFKASIVPEPGTLGLLALGCGIAAWRRSRKQ
jgi:hypothetical protein